MPHDRITTETPPHAADRLIEAIDRVGSPVCVGLDPVLERLPASLRNQDAGREAATEAIEAFSHGVLEAVRGRVPCIKFQSACYERYGPLGLAALVRLIDAAERLGFEVILDAKRGDIGVSAEHYAAAAFQPETAQPAWLTINSYLGEDGVTPFLKAGRGAFALVRTSNPGGDAIQNLTLANGGTVAEAVARLISGLGESHIGACGFSSLGAVVGATKAADAERLRELMPRQIFLVPGYGAQGGGAADVLPCFRRDENGRLTGAIVTASRSVIFAFQPDDPDWQSAVAAAAARFAGEIGAAVG